MSAITTGNAQQYADSSKLAARARLHSDYTVAETPWFEWVMGRLPLEPGDRVLDVGCGPAWFWAASAEFFPPGLDLTLADQSPGMVAEAVARCAPLNFARVKGETTDAAALPFADDSFDAAIAMHMLYHVPDPTAAIVEMHRVVKPGGFLAVTTNGVGNLSELYALTTTLGSDPVDPSALAFGFDRAEELMRERFGMAVHPASLRVTDPEVVFLALT
jgi:SAM-dependent methyltransferase